MTSIRGVANSRSATRKSRADRKLAITDNALSTTRRLCESMTAALVGGMKSNANDCIAIHLEPAWRARANFIIAAEIGGTALRPEREQLWARQTDEFCFELCCIPFFVYDLA